MADDKKPLPWGDSTRPGDVAAMAAVTPPPSFTPPPDPLVGQVLAGRYLIQKKLGEGGMGAVYRAQHTVLEKAVALKILHGEFSRKPDLVERFMQEAKAASRIRHENVIDISDFGTAGENLVFFAMELLDGHDLHEEIARARLAKTRLPWERSRKIFLQICAALSAAHAQGIVHRDLKPENIYLVEWLGHKDFVKLLDFGIAKLTEVNDSDRKLTRTGMLFGTPEYMSPEQARGENVDHRVDVYAMGCILYQLCTGRVPFEAENFMGILSLHLTEPPPPIGPPILQEIGAPLGLEAVVMKALSKSRHERWQTVDEMANAIRTLHGEATQPVAEVRVARVESRPPTGVRSRTEWKGNLQIPVEEEAPQTRKKPMWPWLALGALVLGGGVAAAVALGGGKKTAAAGEPAVAPPAVIDAGAGGDPVGAGSASAATPGSDPATDAAPATGAPGGTPDGTPSTGRGERPATRPDTRPGTRPGGRPDPRPDGPSTRPDGPSTRPDGPSTRPDGPSTRPDTRPDTTPSEPGGDEPVIKIKDPFKKLEAGASVEPPATP